MKKSFLLLVMCSAFTMMSHAQSACDNLYASAVKSQKIMTMASQRQAINYFEKAMNCYDSEQKKQLCKDQIATCRNTITLLKEKAALDANIDNNPVKEELQDSVLAEVKENLQKVEAPVSLSASETIIKFKPKGGEFLKVKINCNYNDWKVVEKPDWISYSISSDSEIICEASSNPEKSERQGMIIIECRDSQISIGVLQSKKGLLDKLLK